MDNSQLITSRAGASGSGTLTLGCYCCYSTAAGGAAFLLKQPQSSLRITDSRESRYLRQPATLLAPPSIDSTTTE